jgi:hypothetical protein
MKASQQNAGTIPKVLGHIVRCTEGASKYESAAGPETKRALSDPQINERFDGVFTPVGRRGRLHRLTNP